MSVLATLTPCFFLERCQGHTHKGHREKVLNVVNFRIFQGVFGVFSGYFQVFFRIFHGVFMVFSGCFQGVFPYGLSGYALWTLSIFKLVAYECGNVDRVIGVACQRFISGLGIQAALADGKRTSERAKEREREREREKERKKERKIVLSRSHMWLHHL